MKILLSLTMFDQKHWTKEKRQVTILINRYYIAIDSDSKYLHIRLLPRIETHGTNWTEFAQEGSTWDE